MRSSERHTSPRGTKQKLAQPAPLFPSANPKILIGQRELDVQTYILPIKSPAESTYQWQESLGDTKTYSIRGYRLHIQHILVLLRRI
jgi:hypothetical protein